MEERKKPTKKSFCYFLICIIVLVVFICVLKSAISTGQHTYIENQKMTIGLLVCVESYISKQITPLGEQKCKMLIEKWNKKNEI